MKSLLEKNAIETVNPRDSQVGFYSTIFIVPKQSGGFRAKLMKIKQILKESAIQNGNFHDSVSKYRGLGLFYRSFRRLFAYSYPFRKQKISTICNRREDLSVSSTSFRNLCCPAPIHKSSFNLTRLLASERITSSCLFRWLADQKSRLSPAYVRKTAYNLTNFVTRFHNK